MSLEFRHIAHSYGQVRALEDISFTASQGEITCLLGASGCGKSTLLSLAAGLLAVQQGSVHIGDAVMADAAHNPPPEARPVGLVFQDGALFPHMNVARNVGFGLAQDGQMAVEQWLDRVGLSGLGARYPHELSGGQQQRAALARAMAPDPQVLLMDEPFASVDIVLRRQLRRDCRRLLRERGATVVMVTHDPEEALDIADRIAVMEAGRIVQIATPHELYQEPASASVGAIFRGAQTVAAMRESEGLVTPFGIWPLNSVVGDGPDAERFDLLFHAEDLDLIETPDGMAVLDIQPIGAARRILLANDTGEEISVVTDQVVSAESRYRAVPHVASVRAFAKE